MSQKNPSFTLIELMIVVAIIAFLAAIAVPRYFNYFAKARQAEVAINLASLHTAMQTYWAEHGRYTMQLAGEGGIGWQPEGYKGGGAREQFYYTYGFNFPGAQEGIHYFTGKLGTPKEAMGECHADQHTFVVKAAGDLNGKQADVWAINETHALEHLQQGAE